MVGLEAGGLELFGDVLCGLVVLGRTGPVGCGGEDLQVLAGELGVGNGEEDRVPLGLLGEVAIAEDLLGGRASAQSGAAHSGQQKEGRGGERKQMRGAERADACRIRANRRLACWGQAFPL